MKAIALKLPSGSSKFGAQMGRCDVLPENREVKVKLHLTRLKWVDGDYDQWGAYFGSGNPGEYIYCAWVMSPACKAGDFPAIQVFVRATARWTVKASVWNKLPNATFYR